MSHKERELFYWFGLISRWEILILSCIRLLICFELYEVIIDQN